MLKSMTGFGRSEIVTDECKISVEMKSVNHRYLDLGIKMPKKFNYFEAAIRNLLKGYIQRGKVDLFISYEDYTEGNVSLRYNRQLAAEYMQAFKEMAEQFGIENDVKVSALSRCPEVLTMEQEPEDEDKMWKVLETALRAVSYTHLDVYKRQHQEACVHLDRTVNQIKEAGLKAGVALNPATPVSTLSCILDQVDMVLIMSTWSRMQDLSLIHI